jgi:hypothetical protein
MFFIMQGGLSPGPNLVAMVINPHSRGFFILDRYLKITDFDNGCSLSLKLCENMVSQGK